MPSLSLDERRAIVFGAMSVYERVASYTVRGTSSTDSDSDGNAAGNRVIRPEANAALQSWSRAFSPKRSRGVPPPAAVGRPGLDDRRPGALRNLARAGTRHGVDHLARPHSRGGRGAREGARGGPASGSQLLRARRRAAVHRVRRCRRPRRPDLSAEVESRRLRDVHRSGAPRHGAPAREGARDRQRAHAVRAVSKSSGHFARRR